MKAITGIGQRTMYKSSFLINLHCQQSIEFLLKSQVNYPKFTLKQSHRHYCLKFLDVDILKGASEQRVRISPALR